MSAAYIIAYYDIQNSKKYESYPPAVIPLLKKHNAEVLVASYNAQAIEGKGNNAIIVLKFPSEAAAMNWYNDPEYAAIKKIRTDSTIGSLILAKEFVMVEDEDSITV